MSHRLQCPICLELLGDPRQLLCSHTFCKRCLSHILTCSSQKTANSLACPICQTITEIRDGDVDNLTTNDHLKTFVDDSDNVQHLCDMCDSETKALHFCCECGKNMCNKCLEKHNNWSPNLKHRVENTEDIRQGKVVIKRKVFCKEHKPDEEEHVCTDVCLTCKKFICERCRLIKHKNHTVKDAEEYKDYFEEHVESAQARCEIKTTTVKNHLARIEDQEKRVNDHIDGRKNEMSKIYQESIKKLNESKASLDEKLEAKRVELCQRLAEMKDSDERLVASIESASVLAGNSLKAPLDDDTIHIHDSLSSELKNLLDREDPKEKLATDVTARAEEIIVTPNKHLDELDIGEVGLRRCKLVTVIIWMSILTLILSALQRYYHPGHWIKICDVELSEHMSSVTPTPDGMMAIGYEAGGVDLFSPEGRLQQTVLNGVQVDMLGCLSDGRYIVLEFLGDFLFFTMYTKKKVKLNMQNAEFEEGHSWSMRDNHYASLTVDVNDNIYVSDIEAKNIEVFSAVGKVIRKIPCNGYVPMRITSYKDSLIITTDSKIRMIDKKGSVKYVVERLGLNSHVAVTKHDSILIAWIKHHDGLVSIDEYNSNLEHIQNIVSDQKIKKPSENWYYLQVFKSGEISFCTYDRLYIFQLSLKPINV